MIGPMQPVLEPPDSHYLNAATGWLELGLPDEAEAELRRLSRTSRLHPDSLAVEWEILARTQRWREALTVATLILEIDATRPTGWINRSYALHELKRTAEARQALLVAHPRFPTVGVIPYNLACYACQMGHLEEARRWLREAIARDGRAVVVDRARQDPDLRPMLAEIELL